MTDRMPPIPDATLTPAQRDAVADFTQTRGTDRVEGPFVPLLRSPELLRRVQRLGAYLRYRSALPPRLSELAILVTARHWSQDYEWGVHAPIAAEAGVPQAVIDAIGGGRRPDALDTDQTMVYDFCQELLLTRRVGDATYDRAVSLFGEQGVVDLAGILGYYTLLAMVMNTARTPPAPGMAALPRSPDPA